MLRALIWFLCTFAFSKMVCCTDPQSLMGLSLPGSIRDGDIVLGGKQKTFKTPKFCRGFYLLYVPRGWLNLIKHNFWENIHLTQANDSQSLIAVPGPWIFCEFTSLPPIFSLRDVSAKPEECPEAQACLHMLTLYQQLCNGPVLLMWGRSWATILCGGLCKWPWGSSLKLHYYSSHMKANFSWPLAYTKSYIIFENFTILVENTQFS